MSYIRFNNPEPEYVPYLNIDLGESVRFLSGRINGKKFLIATMEDETQEVMVHVAVKRRTAIVEHEQPARMPRAIQIQFA